MKSAMRLPIAPPKKRDLRLAKNAKIASTGMAASIHSKADASLICSKLYILPREPKRFFPCASLPNPARFRQDRGWESSNPIAEHNKTMNRDRLLQRFLRYVRIDTTASPDETKYPSSPGQLDFGRLLVEELQAIGIRDARQDEHGVVLATVPGTGSASGTPPVIALCSHLDTSPETTGAGVNPQVIENYSGGDIAPQGRPSDPRRRQPWPGVAAGADADYLRRHDLAGRRRQGRRGHHHGDRRLAGRAP